MSTVDILNVGSSGEVYITVYQSTLLVSVRKGKEKPGSRREFWMPSEAIL